MKISEFAQRTGKSIETLRRWDKKGLIVPNRTLSGQREYDESHYKQYLALKNLKNADRNVLILELSTHEEHPFLCEKVLSKIYKQYIINLNDITNIMFSKEENYIHYVDISFGHDKIRVSFSNYKNHLILAEKQSYLIDELDAYLNNLEYVLSSVREQDESITHSKLEEDDTSDVELGQIELEDDVLEDDVLEDDSVEDMNVEKISDSLFFNDKVASQSSNLMNEQDVANMIEKKLKEYGFLS